MGYVGILALILILFGFVVVLSFHHQVTVQQNRLLEQRVESLAKSPTTEGGAPILEDPRGTPGSRWPPMEQVQAPQPPASSLVFHPEALPRVPHRCRSGIRHGRQAS